MAKLDNEVALGLHLSAGASDKYLTSAEYIYDETKGQKLQTTIDALGTGSGLSDNYASILNSLATNQTIINGDPLEGQGNWVDSDFATALLEVVNYTLPVATDSVLGGIKVGDNLSISDGVLSVPAATSTAAGVMSADDKAKLDALVASSGSSSYVLPTASADTLGGVKVGTGLSIADDGTLSADNSETMTAITDDEITALFE